MGFKKALAIGGVVAASAVTFAGCGQAEIRVTKLQLSLML